MSAVDYIPQENDMVIDLSQPSPPPVPAPIQQQPAAHDDDIIIVDDASSHLPPPLPAPTPTRRVPTPRPTRQRTAPRPRAAPLPTDAHTTRLTRQSAAALHPKRVKVKLGAHGSGNGTTSAFAQGASFLGPYDRELDSSDEDLTFEEQFILRVPEENGLAEEMRKRVGQKEIGDDVWFKFKDSRRAIFNIGDTTYGAKLVDLPCIIESQKTLDSRQMYKVADISQMLLVDPTPASDLPTSSQSFNVEEFIYPHGITPPLAHVRKRRFRKRINRTTIETVEMEVERLLEADQEAQTVEYEVLENVDPDLSDSEFEPHDPLSPSGRADLEGDSDPSTPYPADEDEDADADGEDDEFDNELAAELDKALEAEAAAAVEADAQSSGGSEVGYSDAEVGEEEYTGSGSEDSESGDSDSDEDALRRRRLLAEEILDLERACERKASEVSRAANPVIKKRLEDVLGKLERDLEMRRAQREEMRRGREERRLEREERERAEEEEEEERVRGERREKAAAAAKAKEGAAAAVAAVAAVVESAPAKGEAGAAAPTAS